MEVITQNYHKSIHVSSFTEAQISIIWDFYVTKSVSKTASQKRSVSDYGIKQLPWNEMLKSAELKCENVKILMADSVDGTISNLKMDTTMGKGVHKTNQPIEIDTPKIVCTRAYTIKDEELPTHQIGVAECVLTHIRNSFAHGLTYFFDNGYMMLEDKNNNKITARIIIKQQTLLDWISLIDKNERFYILHNTNEEEFTNEKDN